MKQTITLLTISGSLRKKSSNTNILQAISKLAGNDVMLINYEELDLLPHFNPDIDVEPAPPAVITFRKLLKEADGVIICTPEYAFGAPGVLKNALDWTVSSGEFTKKPLALISASPLYSGGDKAHASIALTMKALDARIPEACQLTIPIVYKKFDEQGNLTDEATAAALEKLLAELTAVIREDN